MQRKILTVAVIFVSIILVYLSYRVILNWHNYHAINDKEVLPFLKKLPASGERGNISATDGRLLYDMIIDNGYRHGLELGTSNGYSALWQGLAYKINNGTMITIEIDSLIAEEAISNFKNAKLDNIIEQRINDASFEVASLKDSLDFVFIDVGEYNFVLFNLTFPLVKKGGKLVMHNVHKGDSETKKILNNSLFKNTFKKRLFYNILISTKTK
jgi:predicted O-methyltransferase YrrM